MTESTPTPFTYETPVGPYGGYRQLYDTDPPAFQKMTTEVIDLAVADLATKGLAIEPDTSVQVSPFRTEATATGDDLQMRVVGHAVPLATAR